jgi:adenylate cyclase
VALVGAALALVDAAERAELPSLRAGIAFGPAAASAGDYFGHTVNLASRVTGVARPGSVLVTDEVRERSLEQFEWSTAGLFKLKGVSDRVRLNRVRPKRDPDQPKP